MTVHTFKVERLIENANVVLFPSLLKQGEKVYLIDCGYEETFGDFVDELDKLSIGIDQVEGIIISHDDIDHLGGLARFRERNPSIKVYCSIWEEPSVSGKVKSERLIQAENSLEHLPMEYRDWALNFIASLKSIQRFSVDKTFSDGEVFLNELEIIHTPGHTRGHISLFVSRTKTLIANDALVFENGEFDIANPAFTLDMKAALESVRKIRKLEPEVIICYHGGVIHGDLARRLDDLITRYSGILNN